MSDHEVAYTCDECGFDYDLRESSTAGPAIIIGVDDLADLLSGSGEDARRRPHADSWSPLEYGCHVRDVLLVQRERVLLARRAQRPEFQPMGRNERVEHDGYGRQDPASVARQLADAGRLFSNVLARLGADDWDRTLMYNWPVLSERSLRWVAVHTLHEVRHHGLDVEKQLS